MNLKKISDTEWEIPKTGSMKVPGRIFTSEKLIEDIKQDNTLEQVKNVACLPGILKASFAMPDAHVGYGMSIGGVAAFLKSNAIISPGMTGFDINCGVRLVSTNIKVEDFMKKRKQVLHDFYRTIPSGLGEGGERYSKEEIEQVMIKGVEWAVEKGFATKDDLRKTEEHGRMKGANPKSISQKALARGLSQLGTLGAGNHFIDVFQVEEIFDKAQAKKMNINSENILFMIHCGSRGFGHQVATDYIQKINQKYGSPVKDQELGFAPFDSELGQQYFSAMKCAVNFAFCNRQMIMHKVSQSLKHHFPKSKTNLIYDLAHNITKIEKHDNKEIVIVRKGATRSFQGVPVFIPGSMSTPSFVLLGTKHAKQKTFGSCCHGAGRAHSRTWAHKNLSFDQVKKILAEKDILLEGSQKQTIEESELSYKNVEDVIDVVVEAQIAKKVAKLKPLAVMIG